MPQDDIEIQFPIAGVDRRLGYQKQPPYTTPDARNVRPAGPLTGRIGAGGSRPGMILWPQTLYGDGTYRWGHKINGATCLPDPVSGIYPSSLSPVRFIHSWQIAESTEWTTWRDDWDCTRLGPAWLALAMTGAPALPAIFADGYVSVASGAIGAAEFTHNELANSTDWITELRIVPYRGRYHGTHTIYQQMIGTGDHALDPTYEGLSVTLDFGKASSTAYGLTVTAMHAGVKAWESISTGTVDAIYPGSLIVALRDYDGTNRRYQVYWAGKLIGNMTGAIISSAYRAVGWKMSRTCACAPCVAGIPAYCRMDRFEHTSQSANGATARVRRTLIYGQGGYNRWQRPDGTTEHTVASPGLSDRSLQVASLGSVAYFADSDEIASLRGVLTTLGGLRRLMCNMDAATYALVKANEHRAVIQTEDGGGFYDSLPLQSYPIASKSWQSGEPYPAWFELTYPADYPTGMWIVSGLFASGNKMFSQQLGISGMQSWSPPNIPLGCRLIASYRGRIVLAGSPPNEWYMSRQFDPHDWDYGASDENDPARPVFGGNAPAGKVGDAITALIYTSDDSLTFGCKNSVWRLVGDPAYQGALGKIGDMGVVGANAWCASAMGQVFFLGRDGLYTIDPGTTTYPRAISQERIPRELVDLNSSGIEPILGYDQRNRGIWIFIVGNETGGRLAWFYDWQTQSFWADDFVAAMEPTAVGYDENGDLLVGCRDGAIRYFDRRIGADDGQAFASYVLAGPIAMGGGRKLARMVGTASVGSGSIGWSVLAGDTIEEALACTPAPASGTWASGLNYDERVRVAGGAMFLKLAGPSTGEGWEVSQTRANFAPGGRVRKAAAT